MPVTETQKRIDKLISSTQRRIEKEMDKTLDMCAKLVTGINNQKPFNPLTFPGTKTEIRVLFVEMNQTLNGIIRGSIEKSWEIGNSNYDEITNRFLKGKQVKESLRELYFNHNTKALEAFIGREMNGLKLSDRVWNITKLSERELGLLIEEGMAVGKSAQKLSQDVRYILKDPAKRFRRVRNEAGKLVPSKAMQEFHPGRGVYRSAAKNALRLTGHEVNMAYETSEYHRQQNLDFVLGQEVHLSKRHPEYDICDSLKGQYPKDFIFQKWHVKCICYKTPILMGEDEFIDYLATGKIDKSKYVGNIPGEAQNFLTQNKEKFDALKSKPYFLDNNKMISKDGFVFNSFFKKKENEIQILATSPKGAKLITDGEKVTWIKPSQQRGDGSFTPGVFESLKNSSKTLSQHISEQEAFKSPNMPITVARETEKAVAIEAYTRFYNHVKEDYQDIKELIWIPKSVLVEGQAPKWIIKKKLDELSYQDGHGWHFFKI